MAFSILSDPYGRTSGMQKYLANATVNKGDVVVRTVDANNTCDPAPANPSTVLMTLGVAENTANATEEVLVQLALPGRTWIADANVNSAAGCVGDTWTMTTAGQIGAGTAANYGGRVVIKSCWGAAAANQFEVTFVQSACQY